jgi:hypothetical protein
MLNNKILSKIKMVIGVSPDHSGDHRSGGGHCRKMDSGAGMGDGEGAGVGDGAGTQQR